MNQPQKKRRRFSFSLRTLMVFMLALCLLFGFIGMRVQRAREQQAFLEQFEASEWAWGYAVVDGWVVSPSFWELLIDSNILDRIESVFHNHAFESPLDYGPKVDLLPLVKLRNLKWLDVSDTQVSDLTPLAKLKNLEMLDVCRTQVTVLTPLAKLKNLQELNVSDTPIRELSPLAEIESLRELDVSDTLIVDLTPLAMLKNLKELDVSDTSIVDLTPLANLLNLKELHISNLQVTDEEIQQLQKALPNCQIEH